MNNLYKFHYTMSCAKKMCTISWYISNENSVTPYPDRAPFGPRKINWTTRGF